MEKLLVSLEEATGVLGLGRSNLYRLIDTGALKTVKIGRRRMVRVSDLHAFVEAA
jgi:excisionase family DNA binding protein